MAIGSEKDWVREELDKPYKYLIDGNEKDYEDNIVENIHDLCFGLGLSDVIKIERQKQIRFDDSQIIIDILCYHSDNTATIFEVKKINEKNPQTAKTDQTKAIGQCLLYKNIFKAKTGHNPRVILIAEKIFKRTFLVFNDIDIPVTLVEFQKDKVFVPYKRF